MHHLGTKFYFRDSWDKRWTKNDAATMIVVTSAKSSRSVNEESKLDDSISKSSCQQHNQIPCECGSPAAEILSERDVIDYTYPKMQPLHA